MASDLMNSGFKQLRTDGARIPAMISGLCHCRRPDQVPLDLATHSDPRLHAVM